MRFLKSLVRSLFVKVFLLLFTAVIYQAVFRDLERVTDTLITAAVALVLALVFHLATVVIVRWDWICNAYFLVLASRTMSLFVLVRGTSARSQRVVLNYFKRAQNIDLLLIAGYHVFTDPDSFLHDAFLEHAGHIRVMLLRPGTEYAHQRARSLDISDDEYDHRIRASIRFLEDQKTRFGRHVEYLLYEWRPNWRLFIFDNMVFVQTYRFRRHGRDTLMHGFTAMGQDTLYTSFKTEFDDMWVWWEKQNMNKNPMASAGIPPSQR